jgi:eukaryotic-like serine/threonine-protein kinase
VGLSVALLAERKETGMSAIGNKRWQAISPHLDHALDMSTEQRAAWLSSLQVQNPTLAADLKMLLEEQKAVDEVRFLEQSPSVPTGQSSLAGQTLGAYILESPLGQGGMGIVWLARRNDGRFEGKVAIKLLNAALIGRGGEARFRREGSILGRITHPHVAHLIDAGVSPTGQPYLVLEYIEGEAIDRYCDQEALDVEGRIGLFLDVLAAVAHAHVNLIVHRDLNPSNVLVAKNGNVKLLDFGIAKLLEDDTTSGQATQLTREGGRALTPEYAAPEQVLGEPVTTTTDVYALGVLLYVLLGGSTRPEIPSHRPS